MRLELAEDLIEKEIWWVTRVASGDQADGAQPMTRRDGTATCAVARAERIACA